MHYRQIEPTAALRPYLRCFWSLSSSESCSDPQSLTPDGCPEIVLNQADPFRRFAGDGSSHVQEDVLLVGSLRRPIEIAPGGAIDLLGIRFEPHGLFALLGIPMHELTDRDVPLQQIDRHLAARLCEGSTSVDLERRVAGLEAVLLGALCERRASVGLARLAVKGIQEGAPTSEALAEQLGVRRRSLERMFREQVGLSPKLLIRVERVQGVLARLEACTGVPNWAAMAQVHAYADQSHLIRDFRQLVGTTPARYVRERTELAAQFVGGSAQSPTP